MADESNRTPRSRDSIARLMALLALFAAAAALIWAVRAERKATDALQEAGDTQVIQPVEDTTDDPEANPTTNPETNTGTDDAGGAGTGVNNTGAD